jgi:hypothetical protein
MTTSNLIPRKSDILDIWEKLCFERHNAYQQEDKELFNTLNNQLKDMRRQGGWTEADISEEFEVYDTLFHRPCPAIAANPKISYDLLDSGQPRNLALNIDQVSVYWKYRQYGKKHSEALNLTT